MAKKKFLGDVEDDGRGEGPVTRTSGRHAVFSHSNARAVQLASNPNGHVVGRAASMADSGQRMRKQDELITVNGWKQTPSDGIGSLGRPKKLQGPTTVSSGDHRRVTLSDTAGTLLAAPQQQQQGRSRPTGGLAGLFARRWKKSSSGGESCNSSSDGATSEFSETEDRQRKKTKKDKTTLLRQRAEANVVTRPSEVGQVSGQAAAFAAADVDAAVQRRKRLKKTSLAKFRTDHDALSTASDSDSARRPQLQLQYRHQQESRTLERAPSENRKGRHAENGLFQATTVYRTGSGSILVQAEREDTGRLNDRKNQTRTSSGSRQRSPSAAKRKNEIAAMGITMYPKYRPDTMLNGSFWMSGNGMNRSASSDTEVKTVRLPTVAKAQPAPRNPVVLTRGTYAGAAPGVERTAADGAKEDSHAAVERSYVGGHYAPIFNQPISDVHNASLDEIKLSRSRTLGPMTKNVVAQVHRSKSSTADRQSKLKRNLSGPDIGRCLSASRGAANGRTSAKQYTGDNGNDTLAQWQTKSADDLSPRTGRRDDQRQDSLAGQRPTPGYQLEPTNASSSDRQQEPSALTRKVTIRITGTKNGNDQYDHRREKSKRGKGDTMDDNGEGQCAGGSLSLSMPNLKKKGGRDAGFAGIADDNVYRPKNGNLPRADSTDSLLRKDQYDFLSERERNGQLDTIDSIYWKGDSVKFVAGSSIDLVPKSIPASPTNTTASCELLISDGGGSDYSSHSDQAQSLKSERQPTPSERTWRLDETEWSSTGWSSTGWPSTSYSLRRRPFLGSTERHRFVRRHTGRTSDTEDLYSRLSSFTWSSNASKVREAPCIRTSVSGVLSGSPPSATVDTNAVAVPAKIVHQATVHDYAEVISFFTHPDDASESGLNREDAVFATMALVTGTWQWSAGGGRLTGENFGKVAEYGADDAGKAIFHFRSVSDCTDIGEATPLLVDHFRLVENSLSPAGSRRGSRRNVTSSVAKYDTSRRGTGSSRRSNDDDGFIGYRRYLTTGSRPSTSTTTCAVSMTPSYNARGSDQTTGGFWGALWPFHNYYRSGDVRRCNRDEQYAWRHSGFDRRINERDDVQPFDANRRLPVRAGICDYIAGVLLGVVTVLIINYLHCSA